MTEFILGFTLGGVLLLAALIVALDWRVERLERVGRLNMTLGSYEQTDDGEK